MVRKRQLVTLGTPTVSENPHAGSRKHQTVAGRQSGIKGIHYRSGMNSWCVTHTTGSGKRKQDNFPVRHHLASTGGEEEACAAALREAIAFHQKLVHSGAIKVKEP